jgi:hypothetical protein
LSARAPPPGKVRVSRSLNKMAYVGEREVKIVVAERREPTIVLRDEKRADGSHLGLWAYLDAAGQLHVDGQDLGPVTRSVSTDGEYEYFKIVAPKHLLRLTKLLGGKPGDAILDLLKKSWTGDKSYELEDILRECDVPVVLAVYSG